MPPGARVRGPQRQVTAVVSVNLPPSSLRGADDPLANGTSVCCICAYAFCEKDACRQAAAATACCEQDVCCGCLVRGSRRCICREDCDAVLAQCHFCRELAPLQAVDLMLGHRPRCRSCDLAEARLSALVLSRQSANVTSVSSDFEPADVDGGGLRRILNLDAGVAWQGGYLANV